MLFMRNYVSKEQFKIDQSNDLIAYIDEAGDEGLNNQSSKFFVVGCVVMKYQEFVQMRNNLDLFQKQIKRQWKNIHFKSLQHNRRKDLCAYISKSEYKVICSCFSKFELNQEEKYLCSYPSMYFVGIKNVIERVSWHTQQQTAGKVHIMIANRNKVSSDNLQYYLFETSKNANKNLTYYNKLGNIVVGGQEEYGIKVADCITSSIFQMIEPQGVAQQGDPSYHEICLKGRFYSSNHSKYGGIWNNGIRCTPRESEMIKPALSGILTEE